LCSAAAGSFFVAWVRERLDPLSFAGPLALPDPFERDDAARGRGDDRVLDAMRPRYPWRAARSGGDTRVRQVG